MNTDDTISVSKEPYEAHYLGRVLSRSKNSPIINSGRIALTTYFLLLIIAFLTHGKISALPQSLHLLQISFSFTLFLALWFAQIVFRDIKDWLINAGKLFENSKEGFDKYEEFVLAELDSKWGHVLALGFIFPSIIIASIIASNLPWGLFQFQWFYPPFLYMIFIELCLFMLILLGGTGFWVLVVIGKSAKWLSLTKYVKNDLVDKATLKYLSDIVLKLCVLLLIAIASVAPSVWIIGTWFEDFPQIYYSISIIFGLLAFFFLVLSYSVPNYFLHKMLIVAKRARIFRIKNQILIVESTVLSKIEKNPIRLRHLKR